MSEQILLGLVGALTTAVGGLVYVVRTRSNGHSASKAESVVPVITMLTKLNETLDRQTESLNGLAAATNELVLATKIHNAEAVGRQAVLETILRQLSMSGVR